MSQHFAEKLWFVQLALSVATLKDGFAYLQANPPSLLKDVDAFRAELNRISSNNVLHDAECGQLDACHEILQSLYRIWENCHAEAPKVPTAGHTAASEVRHGNEGYTPMERTFRPMVRWLLFTTYDLMKHSNFSETLKEELCELLVECSDESSREVPPQIVRALCQGHLYNFCNFFLLQGESFLFPASFVDQSTPPEPKFLENLVQEGLINIKASMLGSVCEMMTETEPFYEAEVARMDLDAIVSYLDARFPGFDKSVTYPYDIEDAVLTWANQCLGVMHSQHLGEIDAEITELEDLVGDIDSGWFMGLLLQHYFLPDGHDSEQLVCRRNLSAKQKHSNYQSLSATSLKMKRPVFVPWFPIDMVDTSASLSDRKSIYSGNSSALFVNFLASILKRVVEHGCSFPASLPSQPSPATDLDGIAPDETRLSEPAPPVSHDSAGDSVETAQESKVPTETEQVASGSIPPNDNELESTPREPSPVEVPVEASVGQEHEDSVVEPVASDQASSVYANQEETPAEVDDTEILESAEPPEHGTLDEANEEIKWTLQKSIEMLTSSTGNPVGSRRGHLVREKHSVLPNIASSAQSEPADEPRHSSEGEIVSELVRAERRLSVPQLTPRRQLRMPQRRSKETIMLESIAILPSFPPDPVHPGFPPSLGDKCGAFDSGIELLPLEMEPSAHTETGESASAAENAVQDETLLQNPQHDDEVASSKSTETEDDFSQEADLHPGEILAGTITTSANALHLLLDDDNTDSDNDSDIPLAVDPEANDAAQPDEETVENEIEQATFVPQLNKDSDEESSIHEMEARPNFALAEMDDSSHSSDMDLLDLYEESPESTSHPDSVLPVLGMEAPEAPLKDAPSRPRTGLQSYPIPDGSESRANEPVRDSEKEAEQSWERAKLTKLPSLVAERASPRTDTLSERSKKATLEQLQEIKERKAKAQREEKEKRAAELALKRKSQLAKQKKIIADQEQKRAEIRDLTRSDSKDLLPGSATTVYQIAPAAGPSSKPTVRSAGKRPLYTKTNKNIIKNALMHVSLAGTLNRAIKEEVLQDLAESSATHFVVLFRDVNNFSFRGLYFWDPVLDQTLKLYPGCTGPTEIDPRAVLEFYKYDSGGRTFKEIPTKSFGRSVDAIAIGRELPMDIDTEGGTPPAPRDSSTKRGRRANTFAAPKTPEAVDVGEQVRSERSSQDPQLADSNNLGEDENISQTRQGWGNEPAAKPRRNRGEASAGDALAAAPKKTVVGDSRDEDDVMVVIPDIEYGAGADMTTAIAAAPSLRATAIVKSIGELENEINESSFTINQVQVSSIPGLDLSKLIENSLCPIELIEEQDEAWDWVGICI
ncbi:Calmodulin-regulated spectrin-associated protein 2 [Kappamyces sp. JEL0680]|nr:Calmodulin-regulated spectrin-associated protein 2 [Kappamyces sp. JEL0680]